MAVLIAYPMPLTVAPQDAAWVFDHPGLDHVMSTVPSDLRGPVADVSCDHRMQNCHQ